MGHKKISLAKYNHYEQISLPSLPEEEIKMPADEDEPELQQH